MGKLWWCTQFLKTLFLYHTRPARIHISTTSLVNFRIMQVFQVMWSRIRYYASHACYVCMCNKIIATGMLVTVAKAVQTTTVMTEPVSVSYNIFVLLLTRRVQDWIKVQSTLTMYWLPCNWMVAIGYIISEEPEYHIISGKFVLLFQHPAELKSYQKKT